MRNNILRYSYLDIFDRVAIDNLLSLEGKKLRQRETQKEKKKEREKERECTQRERECVRICVPGPAVTFARATAAALQNLLHAACIARALLLQRESRRCVIIFGGIVRGRS